MTAPRPGQVWQRNEDAGFVEILRVGSHWLTYQPLVLHVYDEVVCEVRAGYGSVEELEAIMADTPDWAVSSDALRAGNRMLLAIVDLLKSDPTRITS